jgi:protein-S-isoprenylcysteine O-methyltransferase Ste14
MRYHWSPKLPAITQPAALGLIILGGAVTAWSMHVNRFFSSVVRIQADRGHVVVNSGPYAIVRHPGYASTLLVCLFNGMALGSVVATVPLLFLIPFLVYRTITEDRVLQKDLPGYAEYVADVRYRLIPGIW